MAALVRFPFFFHTQPVRVRGKATEKDGLFQLEQEGARVWLVAGGTGKLPDPGGDAEITRALPRRRPAERTDARVSADFGPLPSACCTATGRRRASCWWWSSTPPSRPSR